MLKQKLFIQLLLVLKLSVDPRNVLRRILHQEISCFCAETPKFASEKRRSSRKQLCLARFESRWAMRLRRWRKCRVNPSGFGYVCARFINRGYSRFFWKYSGDITMKRLDSNQRIWDSIGRVGLFNLSIPHPVWEPAQRHPAYEKLVSQLLAAINKQEWTCRWKYTSSVGI